MGHRHIPPINPLIHPQDNVQMSRLAVTFEDDDVAVQMGTFPEGSTILRAYAVTTEAFDDTGAVTVDVGVDGDPDSIVDGGNVKAAGATELTVIDAGRYIAVQDIVVVTVLAANGDGAAGSVVIALEWLAPEVPATPV